MKTYSDRKLESKVASQNRRDERHEMQKKIYAVHQRRGMAKSLAMLFSQRHRKGLI